MAIFSETAKSTIQSAVYDTLKFLLGLVFGRFVTPAITGQADAMSVPGAAAWGFVVSVLIIFFSVWAFDAWQARKALPARRLQLLEHYLMKLQWHRDFVTREDSDKKRIEQIARWVDELRGELMNLSPSVFTIATADAFRAPAVIRVLKARAQVEGMSEQPLRESLLAHIEHLQSAVSKKWLAYGGDKNQRGV